jgi:hypothetical protein
MQGLISLGIVDLLSIGTYNYQSITLTQNNLKSTTQVKLASSFYTTPASGTITPQTITTPQYYTINSNALVINIADFTYSIAGCTDLSTSWTYTSTLSDGSILP